MNESNTTYGSANETRMAPGKGADTPSEPAPRPSAPKAASQPPTDEDRLADSDDFASAASEPENGKADWVSRAAGAAHGAIDAIAGKAKSAVDNVGNGSSKAVDARDKWLDTARDAIRTRPVAALGIAVLVGVGIAALGSSRRH